MQDAGSGYKTYYQRLPSSDIWGLKENVTDGSNVVDFQQYQNQLTGFTFLIIQVSLGIQKQIMVMQNQEINM
jgi:hypothetical protein